MRMTLRDRLICLLNLALFLAGAVGVGYGLTWVLKRVVPPPPSLEEIITGSEEYHFGRECYRKGAPANSCPYSFSSAKERWLRGWMDAKAESGL